jgi:hypothetical protein
VVQRGSGAAAGNAWQKPTKPETLQLWQAVHGPFSQQTPSVQWALMHSESVLHVAPLPLSWQVVPMQVRGAAHGALAEQGAPIPR